MGIASPPVAARNVTVENFLPQQRKFSTATTMAVGGGYFRSRNFLKERYTTAKDTLPLQRTEIGYNLERLSPHCFSVTLE
jgi:hypothetical protein